MSDERFSLHSYTLEARRDIFLATTNQSAKRHRHVQIDAEHIGLDGRAEARRHLQVGQPVKQGAALVTRWWISDHHIHQAEEVSTDTELQRVPGAERVCRVHLGRDGRLACATGRGDGGG